MTTNSTYNSTVPVQCRPMINSVTNPPYLMSCATSLYYSWSTTNSTFESCCQGNTIATYDPSGGSEICWQYCNATSRAQEATIYNCMQDPDKEAIGIWCEGKRNTDGTFSAASAATRLGGSVSVRGTLMLALTLVGILHFS